MANSFNSKTFNAVKSIEETLDSRYSSNQMMNVLDELIGNGLKIIIENTDYLDSIISSCLVWYSGNSRRKISSLPKAKVMRLLSLYPVLSKKRKAKVIRELRLERNIRFYMLESFIRYAEEYEKLEIKAIREKDLLIKSRYLESMRRILGYVKTDSNLALVGYRIRYWYSNAIKFRNQIMEKYMRHTVMRANAYYRSNSDRMDLSELVQNFQLALSRAINKFDQRRGTLTSYINHWLRNAQSPSGSISHEYGIAYSIPASIRKNMACGTSSSPVNIFVPMHEDRSIEEVVSDSPIPEEVFSRQEQIDRVRIIAKRADPSGIGRIRLGIEEILSDTEIKILKLSSLGTVNK